MCSLTLTPVSNNPQLCVCGCGHLYMCAAILLLCVCAYEIKGKGVNLCPPSISVDSVSQPQLQHPAGVASHFQLGAARLKAVVKESEVPLASKQLKVTTRLMKFENSVVRDTQSKGV